MKAETGVLKRVAILADMTPETWEDNFELK